MESFVFVTNVVELKKPAPHQAATSQAGKHTRFERDCTLQWKPKSVTLSPLTVPTALQPSSIALPPSICEHNQHHSERPDCALACAAWWRHMTNAARGSRHNTTYAVNTSQNQSEAVRTTVVMVLRSPQTSLSVPVLWTMTADEPSDTKRNLWGLCGHRSKQDQRSSTDDTPL